jgi:hypothetical protein
MIAMNRTLRTTIGTILFLASIILFFWGQPGAYVRVVKFFVLVALITVILICCVRIWVSINRRWGIYPQKGQETMDDVKRLALSGHKYFAIDVYCKVNNTGSSEALEEVNRIISAGKGQKV